MLFGSLIQMAQLGPQVQTDDVTVRLTHTQQKTQRVFLERSQLIGNRIATRTGGKIGCQDVYRASHTNLLLQYRVRIQS